MIVWIVVLSFSALLGGGLITYMFLFEKFFWSQLSAMDFSRKDGDDLARALRAEATCIELEGKVSELTSTVVAQLKEILRITEIASQINSELLEVSRRLESTENSLSPVPGPKKKNMPS